METLNTLTADLIGIANRLGAEKRREDIDHRQFRLWLRQYREWWILQKHATDKRIYFNARPSLVQDLGCRILECVDQSECDGLPVGCYVGKATLPVPVAVDGAVDYVGVINKRTAFIRVDNPRELEGKLAAPYGNKFCYYYFIGPVLYVATANTELYFDLCYVNVRMILANPEEGEYKKSLTTRSCVYDPENDTYPMSGDMYADCKMMILTRELNISMQLLRDQINDNQDARQKPVIQQPTI